MRATLEDRSNDDYEPVRCAISNSHSLEMQGNQKKPIDNRDMFMSDNNIMHTYYNVSGGGGGP